jgi:hypothetical protein
MKCFRLCFLLIFISVFNISLSADTTGKPDNSLLRNCAYGNDEQLQLMALNSILAKYRKDGSISGEMMQIPINLAIDGMGRKSSESGIPAMRNIEVQLKAIGILGEIGGQESLNNLSNLLLTSSDSIILTEAVRASSGITADDYGYYINALGSVMTRQHSLFHDEGFAYTSLRAIDNVTENAGNILTSEVLGIMMIYSDYGYVQKVREYSRKLLKEILTER